MAQARYRNGKIQILPYSKDVAQARYMKREPNLESCRHSSKRKGKEKEREAPQKG